MTSIETAPSERSTEPGPSELVLPSAGEGEQLVRAHGALFLVTDRSGNIAPSGVRELGMFKQDTRFLSFYALEVTGVTLVHLSSERAHAAFNQIDLMMSGPDAGGFLEDPQNYFHIRRRQLLDDGLVEEVTLTSYLARTTSVELTFRFDADFADIFEVRGARRPARGRRAPTVVANDTVTLAYLGRDGVRYATELSFTPVPASVSAGEARFRIEAQPGVSVRVEVHARARSAGDRRSRPRVAFMAHAEQIAENAAAFGDASTQVRCSNGDIQRVLAQSVADLGALRLPIDGEPIVAAGIPWFCAPFGRDSLLASYEALLLNPTLARDSLRVLAKRQGTRFDELTEEEPGKIFHELRFGEMTRTRETPHAPYYGSIDATPLFVIVAHAAYKMTGDHAWLEELAPAIEAALGWIDTRSARGTQLVSYARRSALGLQNQGWKDSCAALSFPSGELATAPIALCEVQGYCVDAYTRGAHLLRALGRHAHAERAERSAQELRALVDDRFWLPAVQRYAYAIDGNDRKLDTVVSNLGHLLWSRVPSAERALGTAELLLSSASFSGFGVRTLADGQAAYNPLSYHNGTVWPHDNALIAKGMANYGHTGHATAMFEGMIAAMGHLRDHRLPELFCGFAREEGNLVRYPVACSPQAWAAAAPFLFLQAALGIHADAPERKLSIRNASLPPSVQWVEMENLRIGQSRVSVRFRRAGERVHVDALDVTGAHLRTEIEHG